MYSLWRKTIYKLNKIKRIFSYIPVLWNTVDFDHESSLKIYAFSLKRLENCIENGYGLDKKRKVKQLKVVRELIKRINEGYDLTRYLDRAYGEAVYEFNPCENTNFFEIIQTNQKRNTKSFNKKFKELMKHEDYLLNQDLTLLGKYITKYSSSWWD